MAYDTPRFRVTAIAELCEARGFTKAQLARAAGISRQLLDYWINGRGQPRYDTILIVCQRLGVDPGFFAEGLDESQECSVRLAPTEQAEDGQRTTMPA